MVILACKRHPLYKAKRQPHCTCRTCLALWLLVNDITVELRVTQ